MFSKQARFPGLFLFRLLLLGLLRHRAQR